MVTKHTIPFFNIPFNETRQPARRYFQGDEKKEFQLNGFNLEFQNADKLNNFISSVENIFSDDEFRYLFFLSAHNPASHGKFQFLIKKVRMLGKQNPT